MVATDIPSPNLENLWFWRCVYIESWFVLIGHPYWDNYLATMFSIATPTHMGTPNCGDPLPNPPSPFSLSLCLMQDSRGAVFCLISHPALPQRCGHSSTALRDWKVGVLFLNSIPDIIPSTSICDRVCVCVKWFSYALECVLFCDWCGHGSLQLPLLILCCCVHFL